MQRLLRNDRVYTGSTGRVDLFLRYSLFEILLHFHLLNFICSFFKDHLEIRHGICRLVTSNAVLTLFKRFNSFKLYLRSFSSFICIDRPYPSRSKTRKLMCSHPPILKYQHLEIKLHSSKLSFIHLYRSSLRYRYSQVDKFHRQFSNNIWIKFFAAFLCSVTSIKLIFQINKFYHQCSYSQIISESNSTFVHLHVSRERKRIEKQVTRQKNLKPRASSSSTIHASFAIPLDDLVHLSRVNFSRRQFKSRDSKASRRIVGRPAAAAQARKDEK